jgi:hypothetical protein
MLRCIPVFCLLFCAPISWAQVVPMTNDECTSPIAVTAGTNPVAPFGQSGHFFTNTGATAGFPFPICTSGTAFDVWFAYTATATGAITVTTCTPPGFSPGSLNDTVLTVLDGSACPPTVMLGCDDDTCLFSSSVTASVSAGGLYFIRVSGLFGSTGNFYVNVTPPATQNDECTSPLPLGLGGNGPFSNAAATNSAGVAASCASFMSPGYRDLWYSFTPACSGVVTVDTGCNGFDLVLTAYASCGGPELACNDDTPGCGYSARIAFPGTAGVQYLIRVASWSPGNPATFFINFSVGAGLTLAFSSPFGPGSIQIDLADGPPLGTYFLALTFVAGAFPSGWLFGVDLPLAELQGLLNTGAPFVGALGACGQLTIGPFGGVGFLSGIPIYAVALGLPSGSPVPTVHSPPVTHTIP